VGGSKFLSRGMWRHPVTPGMTSSRNIDEYISKFPKDVQIILEKIRTTIRNAAPDAKETIRYQIPTFTLEGNLVHFAAYAKHIGFYPAPGGIAKFRKELAKYATSKGAVQFPLGKPIPYGIIRKIVLYRVKENLERGKTKKKK
jgi:uncharacterized protein YdhG (YjbR/CyaY superfamily)